MYTNDLGHLVNLPVLERLKLLKEIVDNNLEYLEEEKRIADLLSTLTSIMPELELIPTNKETTINQTLKIKVINDKYILRLKVGENIDDIIKDLKEEREWEAILERLLGYIYLECTAISKMLDENPEEVDFLKEELNNLVNKSEILRDAFYVTEEINLDEDNANNRIIFLNYSDNVDDTPILDDIKKIDKNFYPDIIGVIDYLNRVDLRTKRNIKYYRNETPGLFEPKISKHVRIIFTMLPNNTLLILKVFIKKATTDKYLYTSNNERFKWYDRNTVLTLLENNDYLNGQEELYNTIMTYLEENKRGYTR